MAIGMTGAVQLGIRRVAVRSAVGIAHAGRQPCGSAVTRRLIETDAGGVGGGIESRFKRGGERRLLVVGVVTSPAIAEDALGGRKSMRLLHAAPIVGRSRPPVIGGRDRKAPAGAFDDGVGP